MTAVPLNEIEKLSSCYLEQAGRIVEPDEIGRRSAPAAIMEIRFRTFPNELNSLDLDNYFPCRPTVHIYLGYRPFIARDRTDNVVCRSIIDESPRRSP